MRENMYDLRKIIIKITGVRYNTGEHESNI